ncbi:hypothetical protein AB4027_10810 [Alkalibacterium putridalgicola]|uniref:hypothetical protein n=1 Tax=Alkalibacterium putridalgicola TaxID=426703 RepID=UPI0034CD47BA
MVVTSDILLDIITEASYRFQKEIKKANDNNRIQEYLTGLGMEDLMPEVDPEPIYDTFPDGKILIIGDSKIGENIIKGCLKDLGIDKGRVECYLDYSKATNKDFTSIQYNPNYRLVLFGPLPHSMKGKGTNSSLITHMENTDGYPKTIQLRSNDKLKITKTNIKEAVTDEIYKGYLYIS